MGNPYLSIVISSRNDDHGSNMFLRMNATLSAIITQLERYELESELILIDYNPPDNKPLLRDTVEWPHKTKHCSIRTIVVPSFIHNRLRDSDKTPFCGVVSQNTGFRRARGRFILQSNIDILLSNELIEFISKRELEEGKIYRVDRCDVPKYASGIGSVDERLSFCKDNIIWLHTRNGTIPVVRKKGKHLSSENLDRASNRKRFVLSNKWLIKEFMQVQSLRIWDILGFWGISNADSAHGFALFNRIKTLLNLHINRPDFMMMSKKSWHLLRGFPEIDTVGAVDGIFCYAVHFNGIKEEVLTDPYNVYHIDHDSIFAVTTKPTIKERIIFSFFNEETAIKFNELSSIIISKSPLAVFKKKSKLLSKGISYLSWQDIWRIICEMKEGKRSTIVNDDGWGLGYENLPDYIIRKADWEK